MSFSYSIGKDKKFKTSSNSTSKTTTANATTAGSTTVQEIPSNPSRLLNNQVVVVNGITLDTSNPDDAKKLNILGSQNNMANMGFGKRHSSGDVSSVTSEFLTSIGCVVSGKTKDFSLLNEQSIQPAFGDNPNISLPEEYRKKKSRKSSTGNFSAVNDPFYDNGEVRRNIQEQDYLNQEIEKMNANAFDLANYLAVYNSDPSNKNKLKSLTKPTIHRKSNEYKKTPKAFNSELVE